jgi:KTSC domain
MYTGPIRMKKLRSSFLLKAGFDFITKAKGTLRIQFSDKTLDFFDVPSAVYYHLLEIENQSQYFFDRIYGKFEYEYTKS